MKSASRRPKVEALLAHFGRGEAAASAELLGLYRPYLRLVAGQRTPQFVQHRVDASDIVQQTLFDAVRGLPEFRGQSEPEFTAWIMKMLERNLLQSVRNNTLAKRDVRLEQQWADNSGSAALIWHSLPGHDPSPMSGVFRGEAALYLAAALDKLPLDQRTAVVMRYLNQGSLQAIADQMERSVGSVAGLIRRGVDALKIHIPTEFGDSK